ncbi:hypothetical protein ACS0TY_022245 [Phlomoides rotata]
MTAASRQLVTKLGPVSSSKGRYVGTMIPRKQTNEDAGEARIQKERAEPIVAFSKPPPFPPVLGPLVALSILELWNKRENNDD